MSRLLLQVVTETPPLHANHAQRPFHLNTAASVVIVFCGLGASISFMGVVALYFWCFKRQAGAGQRGELQDSGGATDESRSLREKVSKRIVEKLPVISTFHGESPAHEESSSKSGECCSVCLTEFQEDAGSLEEGLKVRQLPDCGHCFHTECIQLWLCSYLSCPLCRSSLGNLVTVSNEEQTVLQNSQATVHRDQTTLTLTSTVEHVAVEIDVNPTPHEMTRNNSFRSAASELGTSGRSTASLDIQNKVSSS